MTSLQGLNFLNVETAFNSIPVLPKFNNQLPLFPLPLPNPEPPQLPTKVDQAASAALALLQLLKSPQREESALPPPAKIIPKSTKKNLTHAAKQKTSLTTQSDHVPDSPQSAAAAPKAPSKTKRRSVTIKTPLKSNLPGFSLSEQESLNKAWTEFEAELKLISGEMLKYLANPKQEYDPNTTIGKVQQANRLLLENTSAQTLDCNTCTVLTGKAIFESDPQDTQKYFEIFKKAVEAIKNDNVEGQPLIRKKKGRGYCSKNGAKIHSRRCK